MPFNVNGLLLLLAIITFRSGKKCRFYFVVHRHETGVPFRIKYGKYSDHMIRSYLICNVFISLF